MITGINHITFAVRDLDASLAFYHRILGLSPVAKWAKGAYLQAGPTWIALNYDPNVLTSLPSEYSHVAFNVSLNDFQALATRVIESGAVVWQENRSEGASLYFADPDNHKLEIHASDLSARLLEMEMSPPAGFQIVQELGDKAYQPAT